MRRAARPPFVAMLVVAALALPATPAYADESDDVVAMVNQGRESAGCSPVSADARLTKAAQGHSQDQADRGEMTHTGSDGSTPGQRATRAGYRWSRIGENVAMGTTSPQRVMQLWMNSPAHRDNILNCAFRHIGVAQVNGYWTQDFARPK